LGGSGCASGPPPPPRTGMTLRGAITLEARYDIRASRVAIVHLWAKAPVHQAARHGCSDNALQQPVRCPKNYRVQHTVGSIHTSWGFYKWTTALLCLWCPPGFGSLGPRITPPLHPYIQSHPILYTPSTLVCLLLVVLYSAQIPWRFQARPEQPPAEPTIGCSEHL
jgi:hypothetical protein